MSIYAVFIGGYQSSQPDVDMWKASAAKQRGDVEFDAYAYPDIKGASDSSAVNGFKKQFDGVTKSIADSGADTLFIVGHSSGCAIANELNSRFNEVKSPLNDLDPSLGKGDRNHITLVDLDGFAASARQAKKSSVQIWSAVGAGGKGVSVNWAAEHQIFTSPSATHEWSLHFSLVNSAATNAITKDNYRTQGYAGCIANLCWLPKKS